MRALEVGATRETARISIAAGCEQRVSNEPVVASAGERRPVETSPVVVLGEREQVVDRERRPGQAAAQPGIDGLVGTAVPRAYRLADVARTSTSRAGPRPRPGSDRRSIVQNEMQRRASTRPGAGIAPVGQAVRHASQLPAPGAARRARARGRGSPSPRTRPPQRSVMRHRSPTQPIPARSAHAFSITGASRPPPTCGRRRIARSQLGDARLPLHDGVIVATRRA